MRRRRFILLSFLGLLALAAGSAAGTPDGFPAGVPRAGAPLRTAVGICEDYPNGTGLEEPVRDFELMERFGLDTMRISIAWQDYEFDKGLFIFDYLDQYVEAAVARNITLLAYIAYFPTWATGGNWNTPPLDPADFGDFLRVLATRYRGKIQYWEMTNEPDLPAYFDGTVEELAAVVIAGAKAVKEVDPENVVILGGLARLDSTYLERLYELGAGDWIDVVNLHGYYETWTGRPLEDVYGDILRFRKQIAEHGNKQQLWLAEIGYSDYREPDGYVSDGYRANYPYEHTQPYQAAYLLRAFGLILATGEVSAVEWYEIKNRPLGGVVIGDINNKYLGMMDHDYLPKPAWFSLAMMRRLFDGPYLPYDTAVRVTGDGLVPPYVHVLKRADGSLVVFAWTRGDKSGSAVLRLPGNGYRGVRLGATGQAASFPGLTVDGENTVVTLPLDPEETTLIELFPGRIPARFGLSSEGLSAGKLALTVANLGETPAGKIRVELMGPQDRITGGPVTLGELTPGSSQQIQIPLKIGKKAKGTLAAWAVVRADNAPAVAVKIRINVDAEPILVSP